MRKRVSLIFIALLISLSACGNSGTPAENASSSSQAQANGTPRETVPDEAAPETPVLEAGSIDDTMADNQSSADAEDDSKTEDDLKETTLQYCMDTYDAVASAELSYSNFVSTFSDKVSAGDDAYALSKELFSFLDECLAFYRDLDNEDIKDIDGFTDYNYYTAAYISSMMAVPKHVMDSMDGSDDINNYDSQSTAEEISLYKDAYKSSMVSFLDAVGYTWDNISMFFYDWE